jgi:TonB family protein
MPRGGTKSGMLQAWKDWEGQLVDRTFHLRQHLGGQSDSGVFLTESGEAEQAAIKLIPADAEHAELRLARWEASANLSHPHLIRLLRTGRCRVGDAALLYVVMEYAEESLSQVLPQRALTPVESGEMLAPVVDVLAYLHDKGLAHGHLKPANIMATGDRLKIASDGIGRIGESPDREGTSSPYDPPEIAVAGITPLGDVWSLGVTLVEALTQRLPAWETAHQEEPVLPPNLSEPFSDIARNCLRRDPLRRWTVAEIAARLRSETPALAASGAPAAPARRRSLVPLAAVGVVVVGTAIFAPRLFERSSEQVTAPAVTRQLPAVKQESERNLPLAPPERRTGREKVASHKAPPAPATTAVSPGSDGVIHRVLPEVPGRARSTINGTVRITVRVQVDPSGNVVDATLSSPGPSKYFAGLALKAARQWKFTPASAAGQAVPSEWNLRFELTRATTKVTPSRLSP